MPFGHSARIFQASLTETSIMISTGMISSSETLETACMASETTKFSFWSLRFHGRIFFSKLAVDVKRVWQPEDGVIKMRWTVRGIPRVPWDAEGIFDGISTYKLDSEGKIYEHSVDNLILRDPPLFSNPALLAGLNLQPSQTTPQLGTWYVDPLAKKPDLAVDYEQSSRLESSFHTSL